MIQIHQSGDTNPLYNDLEFSIKLTSILYVMWDLPSAHIIPNLCFGASYGYGLHKQSDKKTVNNRQESQAWATRTAK